MSATIAAKVADVRKTGETEAIIAAAATTAIAVVTVDQGGITVNC